MNEQSDPVRAGFTALAFLTGLLIPSFVVGGLALAVVFQPAWLGSLTVAFTGPEPHGFWFLSRTSGIAAFVLLWLSTAFGLLVSNRLARLWPGGPAAIDLHEFISLLGLGFIVLHMLVLLGDRFIGYSALQLLVPFANLSYRPVEVALGQAAFYLLIPVSFTYYIRRRIGYRAFRMIHYASYLVFVLALVHGLFGGSDTANPAVAALYAVSAVTVTALTLVRLLSRQPARRMPTLPTPVESAGQSAVATPDPTTPLWAGRGASSAL
ncbi:MAG: ferric reductase-like transmembrane domain-containing protein [Dehalococcoidia bacterium]